MPANAIQPPRTHIQTTPSRTFTYYAAGAIANFTFSAGMAALGYGWHEVLLVSAVILALLALRARRRAGSVTASRSQPDIPVLHAVTASPATPDNVRRL